MLVGHPLLLLFELGLILLPLLGRLVDGVLRVVTLLGCLELKVGRAPQIAGGRTYLLNVLLELLHLLVDALVALLQSDLLLLVLGKLLRRSVHGGLEFLQWSSKSVRVHTVTVESLCTLKAASLSL